MFLIDNKLKQNKKLNNFSTFTTTKINLLHANNLCFLHKFTTREPLILIQIKLNGTSAKFRLQDGCAAVTVSALPAAFVSDSSAQPVRIRMRRTDNTGSNSNNIWCYLIKIVSIEWINSKWVTHTPSIYLIWHTHPWRIAGIRGA